MYTVMCVSVGEFNIKSESKVGCKLSIAMCVKMMEELDWDGGMTDGSGFVPVDGEDRNCRKKLLEGMRVGEECVVTCERSEVWRNYYRRWDCCACELVKWVRFDSVKTVRCKRCKNKMVFMEREQKFIWEYK